MHVIGLDGFCLAGLVRSVLFVCFSFFFTVCIHQQVCALCVSNPASNHTNDMVHKLSFIVVCTASANSGRGPVVCQATAQVQRALNTIGFIHTK